MIEINLLPQEHRRVQATPWPRLILVMAGTALAVVGGVVIAHYWLVKIPEARHAFETVRNDVEKKKPADVQVAKVNTDAAELEAKILAVGNLERSRILWDRLLWYFQKTVPKEMILQTFSVVPEGAPGPDGGKRFVIRLTALVGDANKLEVEKRVKAFRDNLEKVFQIPKPVTTGEGAAPVLGYAKEVKIRVEMPQWPDFNRPVAFPWNTTMEKCGLTKPEVGYQVSMNIPFYVQPVAETP